jgi:hypothetical protein
MRTGRLVAKENSACTSQVYDLTESTMLSSITIVVVQLQHMQVSAAATPAWRRLG